MSIQEKIRSREAKIAVVGLGPVGLRAAVTFARAGLTVIGVDTDRSNVDQVNSGRSCVAGIPDAEIAQLIRTESGTTGQLRAVADYESLVEADAVILCVPTEITDSKEHALDHIRAAVHEIGRRLQSGQLIVVESATYPGMTEQVVLPLLTGEHFLVGEDFYLASSPARADTGQRDWARETTPKVIGGVTSSCIITASSLYCYAYQKVVLVSSTRAAEMVTSVENIFQAANINIGNEVALMRENLGVDVREVIDATATDLKTGTKYSEPTFSAKLIPIGSPLLRGSGNAIQLPGQDCEIIEDNNFERPGVLCCVALNSPNQRTNSREDL